MVKKRTNIGKYLQQRAYIEHQCQQTSVTLPAADTSLARVNNSTHHHITVDRAPSHSHVAQAKQHKDVGYHQPVLYHMNSSRPPEQRHERNDGPTRSKGFDVIA